MAIIDDLVLLVKFRVNSTGKEKTIDSSGNPTYVGTDIFEEAEVKTALKLSLAAFNCIPHFTNITFEDTSLTVIEKISDILVTYASHLLLARQSLIERGREFTVNNMGVSFTPPKMSDFLYNVSERIYDKWYN